MHAENAQEGAEGDGGPAYSVRVQAETVQPERQTRSDTQTKALTAVTLACQPNDRHWPCLDLSWTWPRAEGTPASPDPACRTGAPSRQSTALSAGTWPRNRESETRVSTSGCCQRGEPWVPRLRPRPRTSPGGTCKPSGWHQGFSVSSSDG